METGVGTTPRLLSSLATITHYPWVMRSVGPHIQCGRYEKGNNKLPLPVIEIRFSGRPFRRLAAYHGVHSFIHLAVCLTTGPNSLPKPALHTVRSRAFSFRCEYHLLSLRSSTSFLRLLPRLSVTSTPPCIFPSITCRRRQFLRKMWPLQLAFRLLISCRI
jgi:hypothetical protein